MKKPIFTIDELKKLLFVEIEPGQLDHGEYYRWWAFHKNDSELHITYEYSARHQFLLGYVEFNGEKLKGREITVEDIKFLIELM